MLKKKASAKTKKNNPAPQKNTQSKQRKNIFLLALLLLIILLGMYIYNPLHAINYKNVKHIPSIKKKVIALPIPLRSARIPILLYHYVENVTDARDTIRKSLSIPPSIFEQQVTTLQNNGYTFITTADLADILSGRKILPLKPVVLSFDDGYEDFYTDVFPILKKYNAKAVAYIVPGFTDKLNYMLQNQVAEIAKSGLVEIGAHTMHHLYLKGSRYLTAEKEIADSKTLLEQEYHIPVVSFAYPYGAFDTQAVKLAELAGFKTAVSTSPGDEITQNNHYSIPRIRPGARTGENLLSFLKQTEFKPW